MAYASYGEPGAFPTGVEIGVLCRDDIGVLCRELVGVVDGDTTSPKSRLMLCVRHTIEMVFRAFGLRSSDSASK